MANRKKPPFKLVSFAANIVAGMSPLQALESSEYNVDNMSKGARSNFAQELLNHPAIATAIQVANADSVRGGRMTKLELIADLENVVSTDLSDFLEFRSIQVEDINGKIHRQAIWAFKDQEDIDPRCLSAISEIKEDNRGHFIIKLENKAAARQQLAKLRGWNAAPKAAVGKDGETVTPVTVQMDAEEYRKVRAEMLVHDDC